MNAQHSRLPTNRPPIHPGEILLEEFIRPHGLTLTETAKRLRFERVRLSEIVNGRRGITPNTALRLERLFGPSPDFWLGMQQDHDLWHELHSGVLAELEMIEPLGRAA
jgi:antitoxin HigA-1